MSRTGPKTGVRRHLAQGEGDYRQEVQAKIYEITLESGKMKQFFALTLALGFVMSATIPLAAKDTDPITVSNVLVAHDTDGVTWATCLSFTNNKKQMIQAVKFGFNFQDAFETTVGTYNGDRVGEFAPGVTIDGPESLDIAGFGNIVQKSQNCWIYPQHIASLSNVIVTVLKVRYGDGTIWVNDNPIAAFKASYLPTLDGPHPKYIYCKGWLQVKYDFVAQHPDSPCWKDYQADHAKWLREHASPSPSPSPVATP